MARQPIHYKQEVNKIEGPALNLRLSVVADFEAELSKRNPTGSRLATDNDLFIPFIDAFVFCTIVSPLVSVIKDISEHIDHIIRQYERKCALEINKQHFYYARAAIAIKQNDDVNAMIFWELANTEYFKTAGSVASHAVLSEFKEKFTQVYSPMARAYEQNSFIQRFRATYPFIKDFDTLLTSLTGADQSHFVASAVRNAKMIGWLRQHSDLTMVSIYCQELVNSLVIQSESLLKRNSAVRQSQFGNILITDLPNVNANVSRIINDTRTGLMTRYKTKSISSFNRHFRAYLSEVETATSDDTLKAMAIYFAYMLRNQVLHQFDDTFLYLRNSTDFEDVIGLLFTSLSAILSL